MLKRLIGISAALSMLIVASAADASPRSPMQRVEQVARFAPGSMSRKAPTARVHVERTHASPALIRRPGAERIRPVVDAPSRSHSVRVQQSTQTRSQSGAERVQNKRVQQYARCNDVAVCGRATSVASKPVHRLMTSEQQNDPIAIKRQELRTKRIIAMVRAKVMSAKFKGK